MAKMNWERRPVVPDSRPVSFKVRFPTTCRSCGKEMAVGEKAVKLPVGVMHAKHTDARRRST